MTGTAGDVDDRASTLLDLHLSKDADSEPEWTDQVHLDGEGVKESSPREVVITPGCALDPLDEFRHILDVRCRHRASRIVHEDVDPTESTNYPLNELIDGDEVALVADPLSRAFLRSGHVHSRGKTGHRLSGTADHSCAFEQELAGNSHANTPAGSGHHRHLAFECCHRWSPQMCRRRLPSQNINRTMILRNRSLDDHSATWGIDGASGNPVLDWQRWKTF